MPFIRALFIAPYPHSSADTRYRIEQYLPGLRSTGIECTLRPFMSERLYQIYATPRNRPEKLAQLTAAFGRRMLDLAQASRYDVVFVHKEAFAFGPPIMEWLLKKLSGKLIFDLDDAFWTHPPQLNQIGARLRDRQKIPKILQHSDHVIAGNHYIAERVASQARAVTVLPTVIDTNYYRVSDRGGRHSSLTIGWVGRWSSAFYLDQLVPVFRDICHCFPKVKIKLIGAGPKNWPGVPVVNLPWRLQSELEDLQDIDIGIMPLLDDEYSRYKCGFKMLQYMGLGIPVVVSPVGINQDIIQDSQNGFLAQTPDDWRDKLVMLIENASLRRQVGEAGRATIVTHYSLERALPVMQALICQVAGKA
jgi:glycosyltransferase involved in cell wall biosynthesis